MIKAQADRDTVTYRCHNGHSHAISHLVYLAFGFSHLEHGAAQSLDPGERPVEPPQHGLPAELISKQPVPIQAPLRVGGRHVSVALKPGQGHFDHNSCSFQEAVLRRLQHRSMEAGDSSAQDGQHRLLLEVLVVVLPRNARRQYCL